MQLITALSTTLSTALATASARLRRDEEGAAMVEYGLLIALIALAVVAALTLLGTEISTFFGDVTTELGNASPAPASGS